MTATLLLASAFGFAKIYTGGFGDNTGLGPQPDPYGAPRSCHTFECYVPFAEHGKVHPEWFSYVKAANRRGGGSSGGQLCFTNPELRRFMKKRLRAYIENDRRESRRDVPYLYDISQNDNTDYCECAECLAAREKWGLSGLLVDFINDIASSVTNDYPNVLVNTFAYQGTEAPPKGGMRAADNVVIRLCDTQSNQAAGRNEPGNTVFRDNLVAWAKCAKHISVWDYFSTYTADLVGLPYASEFHIGDYMRMCRDNRVIGIFREHEHQHKGDFWELKNHLSVELIKDPNADDRVLMHSFLRDYYGPAADEMYAYRRCLDDLRRERGGKIPWFPSLSDWDWFDIAAVAECQALFERALAKDLSPEFALRVRRARLGLDRLVCRRALGAGRWDAAAMAARERVKAVTPVWYARFAETPFMKKNPHAVADDIAQVCGMPPPKKFAGQNIHDFTAPMLYVVETAVERTLRLRDDPQSECGRAWILDADASKHDKLPFEIGFYDRVAKKFVARRTFDRPLAKDAYAWYELGEVTVPGPSLMYVSGSWNIQLDLRRCTDLHGRKFNFWVSAKLTGRKYGEGDDSPSRVYVDRVVLVESKGDER